MSNLSVLETRPRLIVGLDFGTTWSGIAWGLASSPGDVEIIQSWPGDGNKTTEKVPTLLAYRGSKLAWGHQVERSGNRPVDTIEGVKLLLDERQTYQFKPASISKRIIQKMNKTPVDVVADYLERLVAHSMEVLNRRFSTALQTMELQYLLTVPAVWSDKAKDATLRAAHLAKIPASALTLLAEPEAAAVYAIQTIQPNSIKLNDCLVVCDAGGGTVDIITYRITQTEPLRFSEVTEGTGAVCGSVMLDVRFEELLRRIYQDDYSHEIPQGTLNVARRYWRDYIKPTYRGPLGEKEFTETPYRIPLPGAAVRSGAHGFDGGFWYMEHEQVKGIFDPIVKQIEDLLADQWVRVREKDLFFRVSYRIGWGARLVGVSLSVPSHHIRWDRSHAAQERMVRGCSCGQEGNQVDHRMARCNYGVHYSKKVGDENPNGKHYWCPYEEAWFCDDLMKWYITKVRIATLEGPIFACSCRRSLTSYKGMPLSSSEPISFPLYRKISERQIHSPIVFHEELKFNQSPTAPKTFDESVSTLCEVEADLSKIPVALFDKKQNSKGEVYFRIDFDLVLLPASASLIFELHFNGVSYGTVRSRY
ncbi:unnamed protein product [Penicillium salamii]|nr:unnamed protein product [Penicillium salamii]